MPAPDIGIAEAEADIADICVMPATEALSKHRVMKIWSSLFISQKLSRSGWRVHDLDHIDQ
ncbi:hypothetical protein TH15_01145 [Thalassospira profundimaris]|uniref:Uncharacterized protein n=1 Tax=Thalassospira indica TaxID=1891279 RepID=A0ABM6XVE4_9PROT|nr:hypothetical protein DY252_05085 [Thalassospira indica]EKF09324.1 hypothetical protein TH2_05518 [Thalassospira profundimaris WP0211]OAZ14455.1 hypothetical protein TH15_01145 [Thalassospira profundimaris]